VSVNLVSRDGYAVSEWSDSGVDTTDPRSELEPIHGPDHRTRDVIAPLETEVDAVDPQRRWSKTEEVFLRVVAVYRLDTKLQAPVGEVRH